MCRHGGRGRGGGGGVPPRCRRRAVAGEGGPAWRCLVQAREGARGAQARVDGSSAIQSSGSSASPGRAVEPSSASPRCPSPQQQPCTTVAELPPLFRTLCAAHERAPVACQRLQHHPGMEPGLLSLVRPPGWAGAVLGMACTGGPRGGAAAAAVQPAGLFYPRPVLAAAPALCAHRPSPSPPGIPASLLLLTGWTAWATGGTCTSTSGARARRRARARLCEVHRVVSRLLLGWAEAQASCSQLVAPPATCPLPPALWLPPPAQLLWACVSACVV